MAAIDQKTTEDGTCMEDLKLIFASNLIKLRQEAGLTQAALAEKINYSDKTVSKWERGEAIPDAYILKALSSIFHVSIDDLLTSREEWDNGKPNLKHKEEYSQKFIIFCSIASIFTLCFLEFILVWAIVDQFHWLVLSAAIPLSLICLLVMNSIWYHGRFNMYIIGALVLSLILLLYLAVLQYDYNFWQLLLMIVPCELIVYLACNIRKRKKQKKLLRAESENKNTDDTP